MCCSGHSVCIVEAAFPLCQDRQDIPVLVMHFFKVVAVNVYSSRGFRGGLGSVNSISRLEVNEPSLSRSTGILCKINLSCVNKIFVLEPPDDAHFLVHLVVLEL